MFCGGPWAAPLRAEARSGTLKRAPRQFLSSAGHCFESEHTTTDCANRTAARPGLAGRPGHLSAWVQLRRTEPSDPFALDHAAGRSRFARQRLVLKHDSAPPEFRGRDVVAGEAGVVA